VKSLAAGKGLSEDGWIIDGPSECLLPFSTPPVPGPFRVSVRSSAAVDRDGEAVSPHSTACLEFTPGSGLWCVAQFSNSAAREQWTQPLTAAFRLLCDSGFGGKRSQGWGRAEMPEISDGLEELHFSEPGAYWLLSLFHPASSDTVEWSQGNYTLTTRGGRVESDARWGDHKKQTRMVAEGSVLVASAEPRGAAADVAPDGFPHPVYRAGFALAIPIPLLVNRQAAS
jgi:CRISPR type III-A-associated RAMP protein Csm4